jgi:hypothetical protein
MLQRWFIDKYEGSLGKLERTPQGGYIVPAKLARTGVMLYDAAALRRQGHAVPANLTVVRVYTPPEVLQAAVDSAKLACVTNRHPKTMVSTSTFRTLACGNPLSETVAFDGKYLTATLTIQDDLLLADIQRDVAREVSMGYLADTRFESGMSPEGEAYDAVRVSIQYNHIAIVEAGRAGSLVSLALDSQDIPTEEVSVKFKIKGVEMDAAQVQAAIDALEGELDGANEKADKLAKELKTEKDARAAETSDEALDALVEKRIAKDKAAAEAKARKDAVAKAFPGKSLDGKSEAYIDGLYDSLAEDADDVERVTGVRGPKTKPVVDAKPRLSAREQMIADNAARGKKA